jgi:antitoxin component YwqK of YwqJK toxin-antitoxin module
MLTKTQDSKSNPCCSKPALAAVLLNAPVQTCFIALAIVCVGVIIRVVLGLTVGPPDQTNETALQDLVQNGGRWCRKGDTNPFTGTMVDYYPGGGVRSRSEISKGLLNGVSETWYTNGQTAVREHYKDGVADGLREKWHENGAKLSQANIVQGKVTGTFRSWHDNGQLSEQIEMKQGRADGVAWAYYSSGFLKAETTVHDGHVLDRKLWKDREQKP